MIFLILVLFAMLVSCNKTPSLPRMFNFAARKYIFYLSPNYYDTLELGEIHCVFSNKEGQKVKKDIVYIKNVQFDENGQNDFTFYFHEPILTFDNKLESGVNFILYDKHNHEVYFHGINKTNLDLADSNNLDLFKTYKIHNEAARGNGSDYISYILWNYHSGVIGYKLNSDTSFRKVVILN